MAAHSPDLLLLHAPSVYDFRRRAILYGPVSDMIPSSPVFEMYPMGFMTIASYLHDRGMRVRIVNLAVRMINSRRFDVRKFLSRQRPRAIGIDLHWMPHAHGALEVARIVREVHPDIPILFGGISASWYHQELIDYPQVDYVLRGDSTEPPMHQLLLALRAGKPTAAQLAAIPNLTWKDDSGVHVNPHSFVPPRLDYADIRPDLMVEMALRYRDLESVLPFNGWWNNPITAVFTVKGCAYECVTCGASATSCTHIMNRQRPVYRSPRSVLKNLLDIARLTRAPIMLIGDLLMAGEAHAAEVLRQIAAADIDNEIVFEFFKPAPAAFLRDIDRQVRRWSIEFSPESHSQAVRNAQEGEAGYTTGDMEDMLREALRLRCSRIDVFFLIGLPAQTTQSVAETVDYCERLFRMGDRRLSCFMSPMGPFLDPGSRGFMSPARFGYCLFARTLEEHRQLLVQPTWERILNYETLCMTRREIVDATYDAAERINRMKVKYGRISRRQGRQVARGIAEARDLRARLDRCLEQGQSPDVVDATLTGEISRYSESTTCDKRELFWPRHAFNFRLGTILAIAARCYWNALREALRRPAGPRA